jgi:catechol 2,3-dioxygenase-like lactoylglutathione lyase family enzyme
VSERPPGTPARLIGINHVALEVDDIGAALEFYGALMDFELRGRIGDSMAFLDAGDQFIALSAPRSGPPDEGRHFGLVVDDRAALRSALERVGAEVLPGRGLSFRDLWGNHLQVVQYSEIQSTKAPGVLSGMGAEGLRKSDSAMSELREKGLLE